MTDMLGSEISWDQQMLIRAIQALVLEIEAGGSFTSQSCLRLEELLGLYRKPSVSAVEAKLAHLEERLANAEKLVNLHHSVISMNRPHREREGNTSILGKELGAPK